MKNQYICDVLYYFYATNTYKEIIEYVQLHDKWDATKFKETEARLTHYIVGNSVIPNP